MASSDPLFHVALPQQPVTGALVWNTHANRGCVLKLIEVRSACVRVRVCVCARVCVYVYPLRCLSSAPVFCDSCWSNT